MTSVNKSNVDTTVYHANNLDPTANVRGKMCPHIEEKMMLDQNGKKKEIHNKKNHFNGKGDRHWEIAPRVQNNEEMNKKEGKTKKIMCHLDQSKLIRQNNEFNKNQQQNLQINSLSKLSVNRAEQSFDKVPKISISATNKKRTISIQTVSSMPKKQKKGIFKNP